MTLQPRMKPLDDDVWMAKEDIPNAKQAFLNWLDEENTWENALDGCDHYSVAEIAVNHFIDELLERIRSHDEEHKKLVAELDRLEREFQPVCEIAHLQRQSTSSYIGKRSIKVSVVSLPRRNEANLGDAKNIEECKNLI